MKEEKKFRAILRLTGDGDKSLKRAALDRGLKVQGLLEKAVAAYLDQNQVSEI